MPKLNREKLLEFLENDHSEEIELSAIVRYCEVGRYEYEEPQASIIPKRKRRKFYKSKLR